ncbi:hypothetical protein KUCAC02_004450 [Chaenocephalus aceratus]|uniref:Uncharacterized protein n=1 Tax=Chaenocephalus aceratus TaxID=36190 RepID=A0ACB9X0G7_CHAAC|nr:hypothetical protein KUCAC02_004450 [Chaenocephalus aceratus]
MTSRDFASDILEYHSTGGSVQKMAKMKGYYESLNPEDKTVYRDKCASIGSVDPYLIPVKDYSTDINSWPSLSYCDIVNYVFFSPIPLYTMEEMKAYKGL